MFKLISHVVIFALGAAAGIFWGVHHPTDAANLADTGQAKIQAAVAAAKQQVLQQVVAEQNTGTTGNGQQPTATSAAHMNKYQQMLQSAQQELNDAKSKLPGQ